MSSWSKNLDIFGADKIIIPINISDSHWIVGVIFMNRKRINIYNSNGRDGHQYLVPLFRYIQDEHWTKKNYKLPEAESWSLIPAKMNMPQQTNGTF